MLQRVWALESEAMASGTMADVLSELSATHCNTLQHAATHSNTGLMRQKGYTKETTTVFLTAKSLQHTATHCNTLQLTATQG